MSDRLTKAPIFYTLGQITFNSVLDMADYVSGIQKNLRHDYPDFQQDTVSEIQIHLPELGKNPEVKTTSSPRWNFKNAGQTAGYGLTSNAILFHTTAYESSEKFIAPLIRGLEIVHTAVSLAFIESVGVRTLDAIVPAEKEELSAYVHPGLLGIWPQLSGTLKHSVSETVVEGSYGQLRSRTARVEGKLGVPSDLFPLSLQIRKNLQNLNCQHVVLDNDCIQRERFEFDIDEVTNRLASVKSALSNVFKLSVTKEALKEWA
jgi:uncharacterized protein (TIGR04255 family)